MAFSAVVLPAPFGPISPRMRPSSTRRSTPSSAMVVPKVLRSPRASMHAMVSALLLSRVRRRPAVSAGFEQFFRFQPEPPDRRVHPRPLFGEKPLAFLRKQQVARARFHKHAQTSLALDQFLVHQFLVALQNRKRIDAVFRSDISYRWQRIALLQCPVQDHGDDTVAKLAVNRLTVAPFTIHPMSQITPDEKTFAFFSDIVNYNTIADVKSFLRVARDLL